MPTVTPRFGASTASNPDGTVGGTYEQPVSRAADIRNYNQMGFAARHGCAGLLAAAAAAAVRSHGPRDATTHGGEDLAILRALGLMKSQIPLER